VYKLFKAIPTPNPGQTSCPQAKVELVLPNPNIPTEETNVGTSGKLLNPAGL
jgi:hypothetical protein